ncbi:hypoxanthine-guanine phosphoribosyltransferase [Arenimonas caeni]|uniref:Hypoxanthine-guanine phosphoribosyltransferase n=1 Tax=Arenimonas caeni TaxID=2058085 RepID=A0A2P6M6N0_9GAMM|nr:hypoxanthine-guanine phosphoribosyltransferase [Arenimonas caeni]MDY0022160.1 hypoxanthine-guanine phosphoribosyltransferase [Arenimonas caeni]PRH81609.1 hypoxanthine-guanine phosphoribosyltransferase [Arenimonas caeni]
MSPELSTALANSDRLFDQAAIEAAIDRIAAEIDRDFAGGERPVYLTIMHGGLPFAARLAMAMRTDLEFDYLHATRYRGATTGSGLAWLHRPATSLKGRRVLVTDDILDEGHTLKAVVEWCREQGAAEVKVAVLALKRHDRRVAGVAADYVAVEVPDRYVYGYGMDFHEQGRNLPAIYALKD